MPRTRNRSPRTREQKEHSYQNFAPPNPDSGYEKFRNSRSSARLSLGLRGSPSRGHKGKGDNKDDERNEENKSRSDVLVEEYLAEIAKPDYNPRPFRRPPMPTWAADLIQYVHNREPLGPLMVQLEAQLNRLDILNALIEGKKILREEEHDEAEKYALFAMDIAIRMNHRTFMRECEEFIDKIEDFRSSKIPGYRSRIFNADGKYKPSQNPRRPPKLSLEYHFLTAPEYVSRPTQTSQPPSPVQVPQHEKRKRDQVSETAVLRFSYPPRLVPRASPRARTGREKEALRPKYWISRDAEDQQFLGNFPHWQETFLGGRKSHDWDLDWVVAAKKSTFRPKQGHFTFRKYPSEQASRWRPTAIFPEQDWEYIIPAYEWEEFRERNRGKYFSMEWLAEEREDLPMMAKYKDKIRAKAKVKSHSEDVT